MNIDKLLDALQVFLARLFVVLWPIALVLCLVMCIVQWANSQEYMCKVKDEYSGSWGTGFLAAKDDTYGIVLTAGHVFREWKGGPVSVTFKEDSNNLYEGTLLDYTYAQEDAAVIQIASPPFKPTPFSPESFDPNKPVTIQTLRHQFTSNVQGSYSGSSREYAPSNTRGGDSGSPVFQEGRVVGIHWGTHPTGYGMFTYSTPMTAIGRFLFGTTVEYTPIVEAKPYYIVDPNPPKDGIKFRLENGYDRSDAVQDAEGWSNPPLVSVKPVAREEQYCYPGGGCYSQPRYYSPAPRRRVIVSGPPSTIPYNGPPPSSQPANPRKNIIKAPPGTYTAPNVVSCKCTPPEKTAKQIADLEKQVADLSKSHSDVMGELEVVYNRISIVEDVTNAQIDYDKIASKVASKIDYDDIANRVPSPKPAEIDYEKIVSDVQSKIQVPEQSPIKHYVLVADQTSAYWALLKPLVEAIKASYSNIRVVPVPTRRTEARQYPVLAAYQGFSPLHENYYGLEETTEALKRISKGTNP